MVKHRRLILIILGTIFVIFFGWLTTVTLNEDCSNLSQRKCGLLWGTAFASIIGGAFLLEILIAHKKARGEWQMQARHLHSDGPALSSSQVWFRSLARVVLASLLAGLPLIVKGAFVVTVSGVAAGLFLDGLVRGVMNWLPPIEEDNKS